MMKKLKLYICKYISGGGCEYEGGLWVKKETQKTITFVCIEKPFIDVAWHKFIIHKDPTKNRRHYFEDWEDGTYTVHPDRCGTPYNFVPKEDLD